MAAQTDRLLGRAQGPGSAHSTDPPPQFHWEAITLTSWHSLHSSWVCFFASRRARWEDARKRLTPTSCRSWQRLDVLKGSSDEQLAQDKSYFDTQKIYKTFCVLYPNSDPWKNTKNINQKTHFYVAFACKILFAYSSSPSSWRSIVASHPADSVYHNTTIHSDSQAYKPTNQSPAIKREELHLNVRGALLEKGWGHNNDVLICYMDFVWSRSQRQRSLA